MRSRRQSPGSMSLAAGAAALAPLLDPRSIRRGLAVLGELSTSSGNPAEVATDEAYWYEVRQAFTLDSSLIYLQSAYVGASPAVVQWAMKRYLDYSNTAPSYTMEKILEPQREVVRERLAREWDVDPEEVALTRGASEAMQICQCGFDFKVGDEVLTTNQDYVRMIWTYKQLERREGIVLKQISIPVPAEDPAEIVRLFEANITPRTRLIHMCHMINLTGQILPVREVVKMAHARHLPVIVDGAQAFAHLDFKLSDLDCDYYGVSLHKWLCAPHGTGLLYVRRDRIADLWPLQAAPEELTGNIRKFEEIGTCPAANYLGIGDALTFHQGIGSKRKEARLIFLRDYWVNRLRQHDRVRMQTSQKPGLACGIANFDVDGVDLHKLNQWLFDEHGIITHVTEHPEYTGIRVTPNVFTTLEELDCFCDAVEEGLRKGMPA